MRSFALIAGTLLLTVVLLDAFQSIILPRRPVGRLRITRIFFKLTWAPWRRVAAAFRSRTHRDQFYSVYGPLALLVLFFVWALLLTVGFALIFFGLHIPFHDPMLVNPDDWARLRSCLYVSGTTIFTLGLGDVLPQSHAARLFTVLEAGTGLGFIALVIGYVPVLYTAFSHREILVALLDARAGSPPTAVELLLRHDFDGGPQALHRLLEEWERWCAEMLETHISYPILCYYRSQHDNQSWLAALTAVLDTCALLIALLDGAQTRQAQLTFAIGRHTLVDLVHVFHLEAAERQLRDGPATRLEHAEQPDAMQTPGMPKTSEGPQEFGRLCQALRGTGYALCSDREARHRLDALRKLYEPGACTLAEYLRVGLPQWLPPAPDARKKDSWTLVQGLRSPVALTQGLARHVSLQSTADHLDGLDEFPEDSV